MLKDLDQRQEGTREQVPTGQATPQAQPTAKRAVAIAIFVIILINIAGWFVWQMYQENQSLKQQTNQLSMVSKQQVVHTTSLDASSTSTQKIEKKEEAVSALVKPNNNENELPGLQQTIQSSATKVEEQVKPEEQAPVTIETTPSAVKENVVENDKAKHLSSEIEVTKPLAIQDTEKPSISIKRRQLSAEELAQKNYKQAQQALNAGDIKRAEKWFEEVLLLTPDNAQARKELAALWFGKQDYSAAHNLLSQGLSRDHNNSEFRLMKARIFIKQGLLEQAMLTLVVLKDIADVEYQSLLASTAQQIEAYDHAIYAYQQLTLLEDSNGKWWLGLAIGLDKQSQFEQAIDAYVRAVSGHSLSVNALEFAQSRIRALGE